MLWYLQSGWISKCDYSIFFIRSEAMECVLLNQSRESMRFEEKDQDPILRLTGSNVGLLKKINSKQPKGKPLCLPLINKAVQRNKITDIYNGQPYHKMNCFCRVIYSITSSVSYHNKTKILSGFTRDIPTWLGPVNPRVWFPAVM
jgi:hypothetical protein